MNPEKIKQVSKNTAITDGLHREEIRLMENPAAWILSGSKGSRTRTTIPQANTIDARK
jgi:hypothetical protein